MACLPLVACTSGAPESTDLGLKQIRLLTNNPKKTRAFLRSFDLEVVDQVPIVPPMNEYNARYLATKRDKLGHQFPAEN